MMKRKLICIILSIMFCTSFTGVNALSQEVSDETVERANAFKWARGKGITTMKNFYSARMGDGLTRGELAKMMSVYIERMGIQTNYLNKNVYYKDVNASLGDLQYYIKKAYQYQIMGIDAYGNPLEYFNPYKKVTRAEFGTVFSRVLYGSRYNKNGDKYYENHLKALKNAGIMTKIDDPFQVEMRAYAMIMMMRTDKSYVQSRSDAEIIEILKEIESLNNENTQNENNQNENDNKKGVLIISSESAKDGKAVKGNISDLDTLRFKASEDITINKIVLEEYGYSSKSDVDSVRLEDQDGNVVSNVISGLKNDTATLTIKKDYKSIYGTKKWTIVVKLSNNASVGGTIGFKLADITSSAKILDMDDYDVNTYDIVSYEDSSSLTNELNTKHYIYDSSKSYKLASFKIKAPSSTAITINGVSFTNKGNLNINNVLDEDEISLKVNNKTARINSSLKNGKLALSLRDVVDIAANGYATFDLYGELVDLIEFGKYIIFEPLDIQVVDKKNGTRVSVDMNGIDWPKIYFDESEDTSNSGNENASSSTGGNVSSGGNNNSSDDNVSTSGNNNSADNNSSTGGNNNSSDNNSSDNNSSTGGNNADDNSSSSLNNYAYIEDPDGKIYTVEMTKLSDGKFVVKMEISPFWITFLKSGMSHQVSYSYNFNYSSKSTDEVSIQFVYKSKRMGAKFKYNFEKGEFVYKYAKLGGTANSNYNPNDHEDNDSGETPNNNLSNEEDNSNDVPEQKELKVAGISKGLDNRVIDLVYSDTISLDYIQFTNNHDYKIENTKVKLKIIGTTNPSYITKAGIKRVTSSYNEPCNINKLIPFNGEIGDEFEVSVGEIAANSTVRCGLTLQLQYNHSSRQPDLDDTELGIEIVDVTADDTDVDVSHNPTMYTINQ